MTEPSHVLSQGFTYHIDDWWSVDLDYRYSRFTSDAVGSFQSLFNGATPAAGQVSNVWRDGLSDLDFSVVFTPTSKLIIRPGVRLMKADVEALEDGVSDPARTLETKTVAPEISFGYDGPRRSIARGARMSGGCRLIARGFRSATSHSRGRGGNAFEQRPAGLQPGGTIYPRQHREEHFVSVTGVTTECDLGHRFRPAVNLSWAWRERDAPEPERSGKR